MKFARINLSKTNYNINLDCKKISDPNIPLLNDIYKKYCQYKKFDSVIPIFEYEYTDSKTDIWTYFDQSKIVAFTLIRKLDRHNIQNDQFAWDYENPKLRLGIRSLMHECKVYKNLGYHYMYLGNADTYKTEIDGYEVLGPL